MREGRFPPQRKQKPLSSPMEAGDPVLPAMPGFLDSRFRGNDSGGLAGTEPVPFHRNAVVSNIAADKSKRLFCHDSLKFGVFVPLAPCCGKLCDARPSGRN